MPNLDISDAGLKFIEQHEGFRSEPYQDPAGIWTIGWGCTFLANGEPVTQDTPAVDQATGQELLHHAVAQAVACVNRAVQVDLTQNQFDALVDFVFNAGVGSFMSSTLLRLLNTGDYASVPNQLARWTHSNGQVLQALVQRRQDEADLFTAA